jgi:alanine dehydrogenase
MKSIPSRNLDCYFTNPQSPFPNPFTMLIGVPKEIKEDEYRVAMLPAGVEELTRAGHKVLIETGAGLGAGLEDHDYAGHGAEIVAAHEEIYRRAELIVKVKEPQPREVALLRRGQVVMGYFHLAADRNLTEALLRCGSIAVALETLRQDNGVMPLLIPMSQIAGRMSIHVGAKFLERPQKGRGVLLAGIPGVEPAHILILGAGVVGTNAAQIAAAFRANIVLLDNNMERLWHLEEIMPHNVALLFCNRHAIREQLKQADLIIGAVHVSGAKAPRLIEQEDLKLMKPGSVIVDVAIDQGGCAATSRPTTHSNPTYLVDQIVHYCVPNMPGAVSRTSTFAFCNAALPWVLEVANRGLLPAAQSVRPVARAINIYEGEITHPAVAQTFDLPYNPRFQV